MSATPHVLLITGPPGIGKTTIVRQVAQNLGDLRATGFYTEEIRAGGVRLGFRLVTLQDGRFVMAHVDSNSPYRVGKYGVDVSSIDAASEPALSANDDVDFFLVDEIGKMECLSEIFVQRISSLLATGKTVVATVALKGGGFIAAVKRSPAVELWQVTVKNRDRMVDRVVEWIRERRWK